MKDVAEMNYRMPSLEAPVITRQGTEPSAPESLEVNVIFTNARATKAAVKAATELATGLHSCIRVRQVIAVPFSLPLDHPQVSVPFLEDILSKLVSECDENSLDVTAHLYLSRDRLQTLSQILQPNSLVLIAGKKRPWPTWESRLAKQLQCAGHRVVFISL